MSGSVQDGINRSGQPRTKSYFLDLPPELRIRIYEEVLVVGKIFLRDHNRYTHYNDPPREMDMRYHRKPCLNILRVSKLVHEEAEQVYLSKNLFVLPVGWITHRPFTGAFGTSLDNKWSMFSKNGFQYMRNISIALHKNDLIQHGLVRLDADTWDSNFYNMSESERERKAVDEYHDNAYFLGGMISELLWNFERSDDGVTIQYVELDITHAYCPLGSHRPFEAWNISWLYAMRPETICILGAQSIQDKECFMEEF